MTGNGRWLSMTLRKPKRQKGAAQRKKPAPAPVIRDSSEDEEEDDEARQVVCARCANTSWY
jgi:hypothetical protein